MADILAPDDIRPITEPSFETVDKAGSWLSAGSPVVVVLTKTDARAYPLAIMVAHEVVDDQIDGTPVVVTYSPMTNAAVVFDRRVRGMTLEFGTSGKVYQSDLVLYDQETTTLWWQLAARGILGQLKGESLRVIPSMTASFGEFSAAFPGGQVLSKPAGGTYEFTPYPGYDSRAKPYDGFFAGPLDRRLPAMQRVVGVVTGGGARAYPYERLAARGSPAVVEAGDVVVFWGGAARSPLDTSVIAESSAVGSGGVFRRVARGRRLTFEVRGGAITDTETGSVWTLVGKALSGPLKGAQLEIIPHLDAFWFSWASFQPAGTIADA